MRLPDSLESHCPQGKSTGAPSAGVTRTRSHSHAAEYPRLSWPISISLWVGGGTGFFGHPQASSDNTV